MGCGAGCSPDRLPRLARRPRPRRPRRPRRAVRRCATARCCATAAPHVALCVRSNRILGAGEPPVAAYLDEGSPIALGTDSLATTPEPRPARGGPAAARPRPRPGLRRERPRPPDRRGGDSAVARPPWAWPTPASSRQAPAPTSRSSTCRRTRIPYASADRPRPGTVRGDRPRRARLVHRARLVGPRDAAPSWTSSPPRSPRCSTTSPQRYDLTNDVLSLGQDRLWRRAVVRAVDPHAGRAGPRPRGRHRHLVSEPFAAAGAQVVPCDFSLGMLARRQAAASGPAVRRRRRDGAAVRRRIVRRRDDLVRAAQRRTTPVPRCAELLRVTRPGGRLVVCEFSHPTLGAVPHRLRRVPDAGAAAGRPRRVAATPTPTSTSPSRSGPGPTRRRSPPRSADAGWARVAWRNLTGGIVALHRAVRPQLSDGRGCRPGHRPTGPSRPTRAADPTTDRTPREVPGRTIAEGSRLPTKTFVNSFTSAREARSHRSSAPARERPER